MTRNWRDIDQTEGRPIRPAPDCDRWHVATCQSGGEFAAVGALERYGHLAWYPQLTRWIADKSTMRRVKVNRALFPGYLFVNPEMSQRGLRESARGLKWLNGDHAASEIPARIIVQLSDSQQRGRFIDWRNAPDRPTREHGIGDIVKIEAGALAHLNGIVQKTAKDRIFVLLNLFGRKTVVEMGSGDARKVA